MINPPLPPPVPASVHCQCGEDVPNEVAYRNTTRPFHWNDEGGGHACEPDRPKPSPAATGADDPVELLKVGTTMTDRLIDVVTRGLSHGEDEETMILVVYNELCRLPQRMTAAHALAGIFVQAKARKWDLVLARRDGTRVIIPCDTEEEQTARALEIANVQTPPQSPHGIPGLRQDAEGNWHRP